MNEGNIGLGIGVLVMLLAGVLLINYFKSAGKLEFTSNSDKISSASTDVPSEDIKLDENNNEIKADYVVTKGDNLWKIAQRTYGDGYKWKDIYEANKSTIGSNPSLLTSGTKLALPKSELANMKEYKIVKGDNLWNISAQACGSGFSYTAIAQANSIANPSVIQPGTMIKITCPVLAKR